MKKKKEDARDKKERDSKKAELYRKIGDDAKRIRQDEAKRNRVVDDHEKEKVRIASVKRKAAFKFVNGDRVVMTSSIPKRLDPVKIKGKIVGAYCDPRYLDMFYAIKTSKKRSNYKYDIIIAPEDCIKKRKQ